MCAKARTARRGIGAWPDSGRVLVRPKLGDGPNRWGPPGGETGRRDGLGREKIKWAGGGEVLGRGKEKKKRWGWAGWAEMALYFFLN